MRIRLDLHVVAESNDDPRGFLRKAVPGLRSVSDEADQLLVALENIIAKPYSPHDHVPGEPRVLTPEAVQEALQVCGTVAGAAKRLRVARSTLRDHMARYARAKS